MGKNSAKRILLLLFLSASITIQADSNPLGDHVIVDSRPLPPEQRSLMEKNRHEEQQFALENTSELNEETNQKQSSENSEDVAEPIANDKKISFEKRAQNPLEYRSSLSINQTGAAIYSPNVYHTIDAFPQETIIKLEDGSEWIFDPKDSFIARSWQARKVDPARNETQPHTVVLSPKNNWLNWFSGSSNYVYVLQNKDVGSSIDVNPFRGPARDGEFTIWIIGIDFYLGQIHVANAQDERSVWEISSTDFYLFKDWTVNDAIIFGENSNWLWWLSSYNHIIINVNMNHFVRARQISMEYFPKFREEIGR